MEGKHIHRKNIYSGSTVAKHICFAMAQHAEQENTGAATPMEDEEEEEEHHRHHRGDRPLLPVYAQDQQDARPLPLQGKSRSMRSRVEQGKEEASGSGVRSLSFSKLFSFRIAASSATMDIDQLAAAAACGGEDASAEQPKRQQPNPVCRSQSMPMTSIRRLPHGHKKRVADSSSLPRFRVSSMPVAALEPSSSPPLEAQEGQTVKEDEEEVGEEEAVCRICMVALGEGGNVLKLECHCKGELALAHRDCALKWFSIKGNANCDVCSHDVLNLPVTLRRVRDNPPLLPPSPATPGPDNGNGGGNGFRGWWRHRTAILVVVSMLAYFCFLEQLLVGDHGAAAALAVSLPFACVLGLFSALTTARMVSSRRYVWVYSAAQFLFVVLFTHLFYRYVRLQAVIAIILSTFAGFGVAICANAVLLQVIRWRTRRPPPPPSSDLQTALP